MSTEIEWKYKQQCYYFIKEMNKYFGGDTKCQCVTMQIFGLYTRKVPFTEYNMFLAAAMAHYIAFKIEYRHPWIVDYESYVHMMAPSLCPKKTTKPKLLFEEVADGIHSQAVPLELDILAVLQYDFEFEYPFPYVKQFFAHLKLNDAHDKVKLDKLQERALQITFDSYGFHEYVLFYSSPLIAASCILACCRYNEAWHLIPEITKIFTEHIKVNDVPITIETADIEMIADDIAFKKTK